MNQTLNRNARFSLDACRQYSLLVAKSLDNHGFFQWMPWVLKFPIRDLPPIPPATTPFEWSPCLQRLRRKAKPNALSPRWSRNSRHTNTYAKWDLNDSPSPKKFIPLNHHYFEMTKSTVFSETGFPTCHWGCTSINSPYGWISKQSKDICTNNTTSNLNKPLAKVPTSTVAQGVFFLSKNLQALKQLARFIFLVVIPTLRAHDVTSLLVVFNQPIWKICASQKLKSSIIFPKLGGAN